MVEEAAEAQLEAQRIVLNYTYHKVTGVPTHSLTPLANYTNLKVFSNIQKT